MSGPRFTKLVESLPASVPFVGPEAQERARGRAFTARIGANESVFGPSPKAIAAMQAAATEVWKYGDPENHDLRHALAAHHGIAPENIMIGEGIDTLLGYLVRLVVGPGDAVVTSAAPLSAGQEKEIANSLRERLGREVRITTEIDESLIGGAVIRAGDVVIDGSLRARLEGLANALTK